MEVSERIKMIIDYYGENKNTFSKKIGLSNNVTIGRIINENRKPSYEILSKIATNYPEINTKWLLVGEGEMINNENPTSKQDLSTVSLLEILVDKNEELLRDESFKSYIKMNMEYLMIDEVREKKKQALIELREIAYKKLKGKKNRTD